jgi:transposase
VHLCLGIDVACRAAHQASLADEAGRQIWVGRRFRTTANDLERLWDTLPKDEGANDVTVVMEPTRNAWVPLAAWFRRRGATVVLVPPEQSADLRTYYGKHIKSDRLDSRMLARLPLLHPEGLHADHGLGPGDALRRTTRLRQTLVKRRTKSIARLDALLEILGPGWVHALGNESCQHNPAAVPGRWLCLSAHSETPGNGAPEQIPLPTLTWRVGRRQGHRPTQCGHRDPRAVVG